MMFGLDRWYNALKKYVSLNRAYDRFHSAYWSFRTRILQRIRTLRFPFTVRHLHGPPAIPAEEDDLIVVCLVQNGVPYVEEFIDHYHALGAKHLVFLDNGSTDGTIPIIRDHSRTTVLASDADFGKYRTIMKRYLISRYGNENWVLCADIDEYFDYPYSGQIGLDHFLSYLNENGYNAVVLHMLDMLPGKPLSQIDESDSLRESHVYYDTSNIAEYDHASNSWLEGNVIDNPELRTYRQGVRHELFEMRPDRPLLSKHTLLRLTNGLRTGDIRTHHIDNAIISDISCVLYHYKFHSRFIEYVRQAVEEGTHSNDSEEYVSYLQTLQDEDLTLKTNTMSRLESIQDLVECGFLKVSAEYEDYVQTIASA